MNFAFRIGCLLVLPTLIASVADEFEAAEQCRDGLLRIAEALGPENAWAERLQGPAGEFAVRGVVPSRGGLKCVGRLRPRKSEEITDSRWGVSCHWITDKHELTTAEQVEQLARLGAKWALLVPDWDRIETEKGKYGFNSPGHRLDDAVEGMARHKIHPVIQIYGGNRLYMPRATDPNQRQAADAARLLDDPETRQAWHRFLETLVHRYRARVNVWEIWNEPNGPWFWQAPTTVAQYGRLVKDAAAIIRQIDPDATILAGSTAGVPLDFFRGLLESEGADSFDFCSVHPYGAVPEQAADAVRQLQQLLASRDKPPLVWQTECGFPSSADTAGWGFGGPWDEAKHAKWVLRRLLADAALDMRLSIYFVLNDYPGVLERGPNRGTLGINRKGLHFFGSWQPKPAAYAFRNLATLLDDRLQPKPVRAAVDVFDVDEKGEKSLSSRQVHTYTLAEKSDCCPAIVYWLAVPMQTEFSPVKTRITLAGTDIPEPILVDLLDGRVYRVDEVDRGPAAAVFRGLPLADSPLVLCSRRIVTIDPCKE